MLFVAFFAFPFQIRQRNRSTSVTITAFAAGFCRKVRAGGCLVYARRRRTSEDQQMAIESKGSHFEWDVILWDVRWYVAYPVSYRQLEEMMEGRGVEVDHSTLNRWVLKYAPLLEQEFRARKCPASVNNIVEQDHRAVTLRAPVELCAHFQACPIVGSTKMN
jgi:hypothetical protein